MWQDIDKCRVFFDEFAKEKGFDPLDPKNWYSIDIKTIKAKTVTLIFFILFAFVSFVVFWFYVLCFVYVFAFVFRFCILYFFF